VEFDSVARTFLSALPDADKNVRSTKTADKNVAPHKTRTMSAPHEPVRRPLTICGFW
jgi:hypothetical protein